MNLAILVIVFLVCRVRGEKQDNAQYCEASDEFGEGCAGNFGEPFDRYGEPDDRPRYLLYDVCSYEGFNLHRDVYARMARLTKLLGPNWTLVLPEWSAVAHWPAPEDAGKSDTTTTTRTKLWRTYFDVNSLQAYVPVLEFEDFRRLLSADSKNANKTQIDQVLELDHSDQAADIDQVTFRIEQSQTGRTFALNAETGAIEHLGDESLNRRVQFRNLSIVQLEGDIHAMSDIVRRYYYRKVRTLWISHAETIVHSLYGDDTYWTIRRSMRFSARLRHIADMFRLDHLYSNDRRDRTELTADWRDMERHHGDALGGPYLGIHLRQGDLATGRPAHVPSLECALKQMRALAINLLDLRPFERVYLATDLERDQYRELRDQLQREAGVEVYNFADVELRTDLSAGELAIIDQWIVSHARWFVGTAKSAFTSRVMEEREILGFATNTTFNTLCPHCDHRLALKICKPHVSFMIAYT